MEHNAREEQRLAALAAFAVLDSPPEPGFDRITRIAAAFCSAPIALVSLIDRERQWFKSTCGLAGNETPRQWAFCAHAIQEEGVMVVPDATRDPRFRDNPLVTGEPHIRFYAGAPLVTEDGFSLGTVCVIDVKPRPGLGERECAVLQDLASLAMDLLELRRLRGARC